MFLPLLLLGGAFIASLTSSGIAGQAVVAGELLGGGKAKRKVKDLEKSNRLGLNPEYAKFKAERVRKIYAAVGTDVKVEEGFRFAKVTIPPDELDEDKKWMAGEYLLTEQERDQLIEAMMEDITSIDIEWLREVSKRRRQEQN